MGFDLSAASMGDHHEQTITPREMVRAHAGIVLQLITTISAVVIAASLVPMARQAKIWEACHVTSLQWHAKWHVDNTMGDTQDVHQAWATRFCNGGSLRPRE
jgi:hypothetical protein